MNNIARWNPMRELRDMSERLDHLFGRSFVPSSLSETNSEALITAPEWSPSIDIIETPEEYWRDKTKGDWNKSYIALDGDYYGYQGNYE